MDATVTEPTVSEPAASADGPALSGASILARNAEIVLRRSNAEVVALDASRGLFFSLNETADFILAALDGYRTLDQVADALTEEFEVDAETARTAVLTVCRDLVAQNFAHVTG